VMVRQRATPEGARPTSGAGRAGEDGRSPSYWLILGLVIDEPSYGYEISSRYKSRFSDLVPLTVPRVYAALDRLRDDGLIEPLALEDTPEVPKQHLMRRSYRASAQGAAAYRDWLVEQFREDPMRAQLLTRITSVLEMGVDAMLKVVDRYAQVCLEELRALPGPTDGAVRESGGLEQLASTLLDDQQRRELRARYDWAVHARQMLEAYSEESSAES
jgi:DNA-binding PadR family transcriptional regulator